MSKIKISKAIHNDNGENYIPAVVVISVSKIKISKAIHNPRWIKRLYAGVVIIMSQC